MCLFFFSTFFAKIMHISFLGGYMFLSGIFSLLSKLLLFTGRIETKNAFDKPLSQTEEKECFLKMKSGDKLAEEKLIRHNLRLVAHIAKKYRNSSIVLYDCTRK